jgi:DNA-binding Lrp family transcriptional regulator
LSATWTPDKLSHKLIRELVGSPSKWNVRRPYAEVAKRLGVDEEMVRNRLKEMREAGFLRGWRLWVNPSPIRRECSYLLIEFKDMEAKEKAIQQLKLIEGIMVVANYYGDQVFITMFHEGDEGLAKSIQTVISLGGKVLTHWKAKLPRPQHILTETDWQVISLLLKDAEMRPSSVAYELKISTRTPKRRVTKMMSSFAIFFLPIVDLSKAGGVPVQVLIECSEDKKRHIDNQIISEFDDKDSF